MRFFDLVVGWPGSVGDGRVFANSFLKSNLEQRLARLPSTPLPTCASASDTQIRYENVPAFILGDSAYPNRTRIVTTFKNTDCNRHPHIKKLNTKLAAIRYCVENAFGILKARFRLLNRPLECAKFNVVPAAYLITAAFVIHNFLVDEDDDTIRLNHEAWADDTDLDDDENSEDVEDESTTRQILLRHMYTRQAR
jgi:DDE superfamily endonuclease